MSLTFPCSNLIMVFVSESSGCTHFALVMLKFFELLHKTLHSFRLWLHSFLEVILLLLWTNLHIFKCSFSSIHSMSGSHVLFFLWAQRRRAAAERGRCWTCGESFLGWKAPLNVLWVMLFGLNAAPRHFLLVLMKPNAYMREREHTSAHTEWKSQTVYDYFHCKQMRMHYCMLTWLSVPHYVIMQLLQYNGFVTIWKKGTAEFIMCI